MSLTSLESLALPLACWDLKLPLSSIFLAWDFGEFFGIPEVVIAFFDGSGGKSSSDARPDALPAGLQTRP